MIRVLIRLLIRLMIPLEKPKREHIKMESALIDPKYISYLKAANE